MCAAHVFLTAFPGFAIPGRGKIWLELRNELCFFVLKRARPVVLHNKPVKPHGPLVQLGYAYCYASTCCLSTWWSPTALQRSNDLGRFILGKVSHLDAFSGSPVPAWLPGAAFGNTTGTPEASPSRSSRTRDGIPQSSNAHDGYRPNCLTTF